VRVGTRSGNDVVGNTGLRRLTRLVKGLAIKSDLFCADVIVYIFDFARGSHPHARYELTSNI